MPCVSNALRDDSPPTLIIIAGLVYDVLQLQGHSQVFPSFSRSPLFTNMWLIFLFPHRKSVIVLWKKLFILTIIYIIYY